MRCFLDCNEARREDDRVLPGGSGGENCPFRGGDGVTAAVGFGERSVSLVGGRCFWRTRIRRRPTVEVGSDVVIVVVVGFCRLLPLLDVDETESPRSTLREERRLDLTGFRDELSASDEEGEEEDEEDEFEK